MKKCVVNTAVGFRDANISFTTLQKTVYCTLVVTEKENLTQMVVPSKKLRWVSDNIY